jgi:urease accessory protein
MALNAALHIHTASRNGKSVLKHSYCTPPFKIADITEDKRQSRLDLMLMSSSPGMLDGDKYDVLIDIGEHCALQLTTQSYQRLYNMKHGALHTMVVQLGKGASFSYLPHPAVPHEGSDYRANNKIYLCDDSTLLWTELVNCGRKLNGELFRFRQYHSTTEIFLNHRLVVKENLLINPSEMNIAGTGFMEGFTHQATLLYIKQNIDVKELGSVLDDHLSSQQNITYGITALQVSGLLVRIMGYSAEQLFDSIKQLASIIGCLTIKRGAYAG